MNISEIRELIRIVEESGVDEVTIEEAGSKIVIRKAAAVAAGSVVSAASISTPQEKAAAVTDACKGDETRPGTWVPVVSPMVGTFYVAPSPDADPFVKVGDEVLAGQVLCIVEAMKLMNEVSAAEMGVIREVCLKNATPVEYGTVLFYVEPHSKLA